MQSFYISSFITYIFNYFLELHQTVTIELSVRFMNIFGWSAHKFVALLFVSNFEIVVEQSVASSFVPVRSTGLFKMKHIFECVLLAFHAYVIRDLI